MDPLSVISGVAGVATAGAALASTLFDVISTIRNAPREMVDIARGIHDLSAVLKELRQILKQRRRIFKERLYSAIRSAISRIADVHGDIDRLLHCDGGKMSRVIWAFRKSKATKLLATIESHKSTVQLIATTMVLAIETRNRTDGMASRAGEDVEADDSRKELRRDAETLVLVTTRAWVDLLPEPNHLDKGVQTDATFDTTVFRDGVVRHLDQSEASQDGSSENQIEKWDRYRDDTARLLSSLVSQSNEVDHQGPGYLHSGVDLVLANPTSKSLMVDRLLHDWTELTMDEIKQTRANEISYETDHAGSAAFNYIEWRDDFDAPTHQTPGNARRAPADDSSRRGDTEAGSQPKIIPDLSTDYSSKKTDRTEAGEAPQKEDRSRRPVPEGARWTKISRRLVNPEALAAGNEKFEIRDNFVIVKRILSQLEIVAYAKATAKIRNLRQQEFDRKERASRERSGSEERTAGK